MEGDELPRLIELAVFDLGEMETPVDFLGWARGREKEKENVSRRVNNSPSSSSSLSQAAPRDEGSHVPPQPMDHTTATFNSSRTTSPP